MESVASMNVDTSKFLSHDASQAISMDAKRISSNFTVKMLEEGVHTDMTLRAEGGSVKAHKHVLACVAPVFSAMFQHDMKEQLMSIVDILDMTIDALQLFLLMPYTTNEIGNEDMPYSTYEANDLDSLYSHQMPHFNVAIDKNFGEIRRAILKYQVESRLGAILISALARNLTPENCWFHYDNSYPKDTLSDSSTNICAFMVCSDYVLGNYHDVIKSTSFIEEMRCNADRLHEVIMKAEFQGARKDARKRFLHIKRLSW